MISHHFFTAVARGVEDVINQHGYNTIFCNTDEDPVREAEYLRLLAARQIDGLIIAPSGDEDERLVQMAEAEVPIVLLDRNTTAITAPLVEVDNEAGAYLATKYLTDLGHRRIAVLAGLESISAQKQRVAGYEQALQDVGVTPNEDYIIRADPRFYRNQPYVHDPFKPFTNKQMTPTAYSNLQQLLALSPRPTAIFVTNNQMTLGALYAFKEQNLRCPEDISLISFDDHEWAPLFSPAISVVRQPTYRLGQTAAKALMTLINGQELHPIAPLPVELIIRESVIPVDPAGSEATT